MCTCTHRLTSETHTNTCAHVCTDSHQRHTNTCAHVCTDSHQRHTLTHVHMYAQITPETHTNTCAHARTDSHQRHTLTHMNVHTDSDVSTHTSDNGHEATLEFTESCSWNLNYLLGIKSSTFGKKLQIKASQHSKAGPQAHGKH
jgi:hypothetical protein